MAIQMQSKPTVIQEEAFRNHLSRLQSCEQYPAWLTSLKQEALNRFEALGLPSRRQEAWRSIDLAPILNAQFRPFDEKQRPHLSQADIAPYVCQEATNRLVFVNGFYDADLSTFTSLLAGCVVGDFQSASRTHGDLLQSTLSSLVTEGDDAFESLNTALFGNGVFISIPENTVIEAPIEILFLTAANQDVPQFGYPRVLVTLNPHAKLNLITRSVGLEPAKSSYFNNMVVDLNLLEGASLQYTYIQSEASNAYQLAKTNLLLHEKSQADLTSITLGGQLSRHAVAVKFLAEHGTCQLQGLSVLNDETQVFDYTVMDHLKPNCTSQQLYKGILAAQARSEFDGTIIIHQNAQQSDASQLNRTLMLSDDARVLTRPQLKIDADDVKCSHGATVGQLEEEQLFYLASRGLSAQTAQSVLTYGFAEEVIEKIPSVSVQNQLIQQVHKALHDDYNG